MKKIKLKDALNLTEHVFEDGYKVVSMFVLSNGVIRLKFDSDYAINVNGEQEITLVNGEPSEPVIATNGHKVFLTFYVHRPLTMDDFK